jgi:hypothetical protein
MGNHSSKDKEGLAFFQKTISAKPHAAFNPATIGKEVNQMNAAMKLPPEKQLAALKAVPDSFAKDAIMQDLIDKNPIARQQAHDSLPQFMQDMLDKVELAKTGYSGQVHPLVVGVGAAAGALYWYMRQGLQLSFFNAGVAFLAGWAVGEYFQIAREKGTVNPFVVFPEMLTKGVDNLVWVVMQIVPGIFKSFWSFFTGLASGAFSEVKDWFSHL